MTAGCWKYELTVPGPAASAFAEALAPLADAVSMLDVSRAEGWRVLAYGSGTPDKAAITAAVGRVAGAAGVAPPPGDLVWLPSTDWLAENVQSFAPFRVGKFYIHDSQHRASGPPGALAIEIDAATAFGSGLHASTRGCLVALDRMAREWGRRDAVLDLGCGSGILAIAAAKRLRAPVLAADIDGEAVRVTGRNARTNGARGRVRAVRSNGVRAGAVAARGPYALVLANILARPLARMAPALSRHVAPGGTVVLSGLLAEQERQVLAAYARLGLVLSRRWRDAGWSTLTLRRSAYRRDRARAVPRQAACGRLSLPVVPRNCSTAPSRSLGSTPISFRMLSGMSAN